MSSTKKPERSSSKRRSTDESQKDDSQGFSKQDLEALIDTLKKPKEIGIKTIIKLVDSLIDDDQGLKSQVALALRYVAKNKEKFPEGASKKIEKALIKEENLAMLKNVCRIFKYL